MSSESHFTGHLATVEHRTTGGRAWCHDCGEWCYPQEPCGERRCCAEAVRSAALDPSCDHEWDEPHPGLRICDTCGQVDGWLDPVAAEALRTELSNTRQHMKTLEELRLAGEQKLAKVQAQRDATAELLRATEVDCAAWEATAKRRLPVVEAACDCVALLRERGYQPDNEWFEPTTHAFVAAVDALDTTTPPPDVSDIPATPEGGVRHERHPRPY